MAQNDFAEQVNEPLQLRLIMNAIELLRLAILANNRDKDTFEQYAFWIRKLYGFMRKPVSEWQGEDVERAPAASRN